MSNRIFIDSSILVEYYKGAQQELLNVLFADDSLTLCINQAVVSEYLFYHLSISGGKAPLTLKANNLIPQILTAYDPFPLLNLMEWLPDGSHFLQPTIDFMRNYNLLPNDALILAFCKHYGIPALASHDTDFEPACKSEGIWLLKTEADLLQFKSVN